MPRQPKTPYTGPKRPPGRPRAEPRSSLKATTFLGATVPIALYDALLTEARETRSNVSRVVTGRLTRLARAEVWADRLLDPGAPEREALIAVLARLAKGP